MTSDLDVCEGCLHTRIEHMSMGGCGHAEKDRLGFVREVCECLRFVEREPQERGKA